MPLEKQFGKEWVGNLGGKSESLVIKHLNKTSLLAPNFILMMYYVLNIILTVCWEMPAAQKEQNKRKSRVFCYELGSLYNLSFWLSDALVPPRGWQNVLAYAMGHLPTLLWAVNGPDMDPSLTVCLDACSAGCEREWMVYSSSGVVNQAFSLEFWDLGSNYD